MFRKINKTSKERNKYNKTITKQNHYSFILDCYSNDSNICHFQFNISQYRTIFEHQNIEFGLLMGSLKKTVSGQRHFDFNDILPLNVESSKS